jgi:restriction endonuclease Mrr
MLLTKTFRTVIMHLMKPRNRQELEVWGCLALFVLVILTLVGWTLYERGYLGIAVAVVGIVVVSLGLIRAYRAWVVRRVRANQRKRQQGHEQERLRREKERPSGHGDQPVRSITQERRQEKERRDQFERDAVVQRLSEISDGEFEQLMVYYFRRRGYAVEPTLGSNDRGADLLITATGRHIAVRLQRQDVPVDNRAVQEALSARAFYGAYEACVITNNTFTRVAHNDARIAGVRLIDGDELSEWLNDLLDQLEDEPR